MIVNYMTRETENNLTTIPDHYESIWLKSEDRLSYAPNLSGLADFMTGFDPIAVSRCLALTLNHGWSKGLLPLVLDISFALEKESEFTKNHRNFNLSEVFALLIDAVDKEDTEKINRVIETLKKDN